MYGHALRIIGCRIYPAAALRAAAGLVTVLSLGPLMACGADQPDDHWELERWASSEEVPFTQSPFLRLVDKSRVCLIDSYESQVVCGGPTWQDVTRFGRKGRGPGEFYALQGIASLDSGRLGLVDFGNRRLTLLSSGGRVERTVPFDGNPMLVRDAVDSTLLIVESDDSHLIPGNPAARRKTRIARVQLETGALTWDTLVLPEAAPEAKFALTAAWSPEHGYVFLQYPYHLLRFSPAGNFLGVLTPPHYQPELPSDRDVRARISDLTQLFGRPPSAESIEEWRNKPKRGVINVQHVTFSADGLLWVATTRDLSRRSYIDVYSDGGKRYLGSVGVYDRLLAFDVRDETLVALVQQEDPQGNPSNRIDWYNTGPVTVAVDASAN